jgi:hypothetical protein
MGLAFDRCSASREAVAVSCWSAPWTKIVSPGR